MHAGLCELFNIRYPLIQAGMGIYKGLVTTPELVAAVSNAGGMGCLGAQGLEVQELREAIRKIKSLTDKPFGVDLIIPAKMSVREGSRAEIRADIQANHPKHWELAMSLYDRFDVPRTQIDKSHSLTDEVTRAQAEIIFEEKVPLFAVALGDPAAFVDRARAVGTKVAGLVGSVGQARKQLQAGVDFVICQGSEAGGHVGIVPTFPLLPQVVDMAQNVPVIAAGGIADGRGVAAALALGAQGVWCGTVFLFSHEANLHPHHRDQLERGRSEDFVASRVYTGKPSRTFHNEVHEIWASSGLQPLQMPHQKILMEDFLDAARSVGRLEYVANPSGQIAGMLKVRKPAAQIVEEMMAQADAVIRKQYRMLGDAAVFENQFSSSAA
jgi:nitronate monooxygenase